jgi:hypothetical protein
MLVEMCEIISNQQHNWKFEFLFFDTLAENVQPTLKKIADVHWDWEVLN